MSVEVGYKDERHHREAIQNSFASVKGIPPIESASEFVRLIKSLHKPVSIVCNETVAVNSVYDVFMYHV